MKKTFPYLSLIMSTLSFSNAAPLVVAHRGASHDAPENTLPAFELAPIHDQTGIGAKVN